MGERRRERGRRREEEHVVAVTAVMTVIEFGKCGGKQSGGRLWG